MKNRKGSGIVTIVIILAVVCIVFLAAGFSLLAAWGGVRFWEELPERVRNIEEFTIDQVQEEKVAGFNTFEFDSVSSDMQVVFADTDSVSVHLKGSYRSSKGSIKLEKEIKGNTLRIYVDYPKLSGVFNWNDTDLTITMPRDMKGKDIKFSTVSGDVIIPAGLEADVIRVNTTSGDVEATDVDCNRFNYGNVSGRIELSGSIRDEIRVDTVSGDTDVTVSTETDLLYVNTVSGDVDVYVDDNQDFSFTFNTVSGDFNCSFPIFESGGRNDRKGYTDESASMEFDINTVSGDLRIRD